MISCGAGSMRRGLHRVLRVGPRGKASLAAGGSPLPGARRRGRIPAKRLDLRRAPAASGLNSHPDRRRPRPLDPSPGRWFSSAVHSFQWSRRRRPRPMQEPQGRCDVPQIAKRPSPTGADARGSRSQRAAARSCRPAPGLRSGRARRDDQRGDARAAAGSALPLGLRSRRRERPGRRGRAAAARGVGGPSRPRRRSGPDRRGRGRRPSGRRGARARCPRTGSGRHRGRNRAPTSRARGARSARP